MADLVLASQSPRRIELLRSIGLDLDISPADLDEARIGADLDPAPRAMAVARAKAEAIAGSRPAAGPPIVGADTIVVGPDGPVGKPADRDHARRTLAAMSATSLDIVTGFVVIGDDIDHVESVTSTVRLRPFDRDEIDAYVATGAADDTAGGLELQDRARSWMTELAGCWTNVMGLPICRVAAVIRRDGRQAVCHAPDGGGCPLEVPAS